MSKHQRAKSPLNLLFVWLGFAVVAIVSAAAVLLWPRADLPDEVEPVRAYQMVQQGATVLDVRSEQEWNQGHIYGSVMIPLDQLEQRLDELPRDEDIVVVCHSGVRSKAGGDILRAAGFSRVTCMTGGLQAWAAAGYPLEQ